MSKRRNLSDSERRLILRLAQDGVCTRQEMADRIGRSVNTIHSFLHRSGFRSKDAEPTAKIIRADLEGIFELAVGNYIKMMHLATTQAMGNWSEGIGFEIRSSGKKHFAEVKDGELIRDDGKVMDAYTNGNYTWEPLGSATALSRAT